MALYNKSLEQSAAIPASTVTLGCLQNYDSLFDSARLLNSMLGGLNPLVQLDDP
jgi:hypothetical protein